MPFTPEIAIVLSVSVAALALFALELVPPDLVALLAVLAVVLTGVAAPEEALSGFASPAVHTIAAMFVISAGLLRTGVVERFGQQLIQHGGRSPTLVFTLMLGAVILLSAFINNTPIVVMMIPVALGLSRAHGIRASKLLIPISYASILGGCCTLIGTSTNLVVSGMAVDAGLRPLGMFELAPLGLILAVVGVLYLTLIGRRILPDRQTVTASIEGGQIREYVTELVIQEDSPLIGVPVAELQIGIGKLQLIQLIRGERILWAPLGAIALRAGDLLIAKGSADDILGAGRKTGLELAPGIEPLEETVSERMRTLAEVVVAPGSRFEGASVREIGFRRHHGVAVLAIERHGSHRQREKIVDLRLRVGDVLLVQGGVSAIEGLRGEDGLILLEGVEGTVVHRHRAPLAVAIALAVVLAATFSPLPVVGCALAGALAMVLFGCLSPHRLYSSVDLRTLVLVAGMLGLGAAAARSGTAEWAAHHLLGPIRPLGPVGVLAVLYLLTNAITEVLSNAAAAVLMVPLAISTAQDLGVSERPFIVAVAFAASAAFSTPIGYQTNTIVYGPGGYRFGDYVRVGVPLNLLFLGLATMLIPVFWPF